MIKNKNIEVYENSYWYRDIKLSGDAFIDNIYKFIVFFPRIITIILSLAFLGLSLYTITLYFDEKNPITTGCAVMQLVLTIIGLFITLLRLSESGFGKRWYGELDSKSTYYFNGKYYRTKYTYYQFTYILNDYDKE